ncbi:MAG: molybdate ABC transporter permease subunit [Chloroflexi bacterium]|nr:molybdate ABC transporter permease subunit [Chloroflexota bacterium]MBT17472.1 molybdate ABC transporter permease subunit [Dehalococcoidia bacterium]|tara:strand:- start:13691 stop:14347 length:657 start_codon:yes stop_codon:yes gene_type:complete
MDWEALRLSLQIGISSTLLSIVVGIPTAYFLATHKFKGYRLLNALVLTPMLLPPTVLGYYLLQFFGASGFAGKTLESLFNFSPVFHWTGATIAAFVVSAPFLIRSAQAGFESLDISLQDAAKAHGVDPLSVFLKITIPLAAPSIAAGIAMTLARSIGEFGATIMIAGNIPGKTRTMPIAIYDAVQSGRINDAQVSALALSFLSIGLLMLASTLITKKS